MADKVTFDFENNQIIFDTDGQKGIEIDLQLAEKKAAIMAAAGYEEISTAELRRDINEMCHKNGFPPLCPEE